MGDEINLVEELTAKLDMALNVLDEKNLIIRDYEHQLNARLAARKHQDDVMMRFDNVRRTILGGDADG